MYISTLWYMDIKLHEIFYLMLTTETYSTLDNEGPCRLPQYYYSFQRYREKKKIVVRKKIIRCYKLKFMDE